MEFYCDLLHRLLAAEDEITQIDIIHQLDPYITAGCGLETLCQVAMETVNHRVREAVIKRLKSHSAEANQCFSHYARPGENSIRRRGALICLGLMECTTAKEVVLEGLQARSFAVRWAASLNAGLYYDKSALEAFERFFEQNRLELCLNFMRCIPKKSKSGENIPVSSTDQDRFERETTATTI